MMLVLAGAGLFVYLRLADELDESDRQRRWRRAPPRSRPRAGLRRARPATTRTASPSCWPRTGGCWTAPAAARAPALTRAELARGRRRRRRRGRARDRGRRRHRAAAGRGATGARSSSSASRSRTATRRWRRWPARSRIGGADRGRSSWRCSATRSPPSGCGRSRRMRARAAGISLDGEAERLPLPPARDEVRRLGETLNAMLDRLRRSYERERRFVADASHELRTPIAVIKAELEGALRRRPADPDLREALTAAVDECDHLAQLAEDLLVVARGGDGALAVRPRPLEAAELLEGVRLRFSARAAEHGRELRVEAPDGLELRRRRAAARPGARQPRRQRAAPRAGRDHAARQGGRRRGRARGRRRGPRLRRRLRRPRVRALHPRRRGAHARRRRARPRDRARDRRGPRRHRRAGRRRGRADPAAVSGRSKLATVRCRHANARRYDMKDKLKGVLIATGVIAVLADGRRRDRRRHRRRRRDDARRRRDGDHRQRARARERGGPEGDRRRQGHRDRGRRRGGLLRGRGHQGRRQPGRRPARQELRGHRREGRPRGLRPRAVRWRRRDDDDG